MDTVRGYASSYLFLVVLWVHRGFMLFLSGQLLGEKVKINLASVFAV